MYIKAILLIDLENNRIYKGRIIKTKGTNKGNKNTNKNVRHASERLSLDDT
jgi:hypothetical protein